MFLRIKNAIFKMHGLGNDFVVVDAITQNVYFPTEVIKKLSDRHYGIGFDQLLVVEPLYDPNWIFIIEFSMLTVVR